MKKMNSKSSWLKKTLTVFLCLFMSLSVVVPLKVKASVGTMELNVTDAQGTAVDLSKLVLGNLENGQVSISVPIQQGTVEDTIVKISIPDFYKFVNLIYSGTYYSSAILHSNVESNANARNNELTVTIPAPDGGEQSTVRLSFSFQLNRSSIDESDKAAWVAGTWNPNDDNCSFTLQDMSGIATTVSKTATIVTEKLVTDFYSTNYRGSYISPSSDGQYITTINEHGCPASDDFPSVLYNSLTIMWELPDLYKQGVIDLNTITLTAPIGFQFIQMDSDTWNYTNYKNMANSTTCVLSGENNTIATLTINDDGSSPDLTRLIPKLKIKPLDQYLTIENQADAFMFLANSEHTITAAFNIENTDDVEKEVCLKVYNYRKADTTELVTNARFSSVVYRYILAEAFPGSSGSTTGQAMILRTPKKSNDVFLVPNNNGNFYSTIIEFDEKVAISSVTLNTFDSVNNITLLSVYAIKYYTNTNSLGTQMEIIPESTSTEVIAPDGQYLTKIELTYDKLAYTGIRIASSLSYSVPSDPPKTIYPIKCTTMDPGNTILTTETNYIIIKDKDCPIFTMTASRTYEDIYNYFGQQAKYSRNIDSIAYSFGIQNPADSSNTISELVNPVFDTSKTVRTVNNYITNGKYTLHKIMGDGLWTIEVDTLKAETVKSGGTPRTVIFNSPSFATETYDIDLYDGEQFVNALDEDEMIISCSFHYVGGTLDISSMFGENADRIFFDAGISELTTHPITGFYMGKTNTGGFTNETGMYVYPSYENCTCSVNTHILPDSQFSAYATTYTYMKGADIIVPTSVDTDTSGNSLKQGSNALLTMRMSIGASAATAARLFVQPGWTAYLKLTDQDYINFVPGTGSIEGVVDPNSEIVTIDNHEYIKIRYTGTPVLKQQHKIGSTSQDLYSYDPISIDFSVNSLAVTPTDATIQVIEDSGSWLDIAEADHYNFSNNGVNFHTAIQDKTTDYNTPVSVWSYGNEVIYDDPLSFYTNTAANDRNWAIAIGGLAILPLKDAAQGITINPGVENNYQNNMQNIVSIEQEGNMTTAINIVAGEMDMIGLESIIKMPRNGDYLSANDSTTTVGQYLSNPIVQTITPHNSESSPVVVKYAVDSRGEVFYDSSQIYNWHEVKFIKITCEKLMAEDTALLSIPLETENSYNYRMGGDSILSEGNSYWAIDFISEGSQTKTSTINTYRYVGTNRITGKVWVDFDEDGTHDSTEPLYTRQPVRVELQKDGITIDTAYTTDNNLIDGTATGEYELTTRESTDLKVVIFMPSGYKVSCDPDTAIDNDFDTDNICLLDDALTATTTANAGIIPYCNEEVVISALLELTGDASNEEIIGNEFSFDIELQGNGLNVSNSNDGPYNAQYQTGRISFGNWTFSALGTYKFKVSQNDTGITGYTYDQTDVEVTIEVKVNPETQEYYSEVSYLKGSEPATGIKFINEYDAPVPVEVHLTGAMELSGIGKTTDSITEGLFKLSVKPATSNFVYGYSGLNRMVNVKDKGVIDFGTLTFTRPGRYVFDISEVNNGLVGYRYDTNYYNVDINVSVANLRSEDSLVAETRITKIISGTGERKVVTNIEFANIYSPTTTVIYLPAEIEVQGNPATDEEFSLVLTGENENTPMPAGNINNSKTIVKTGAGDLSFGAIFFTEPGVYKYNVKEKNTGSADYTYDTKNYQMIITVVDNQGRLESSLAIKVGGANVDKVVFTNTYNTSNPIHPRTGDNSHIELYTLLLLLSLISLCGCGYYYYSSKKTKHETE